MSNFITCVKLSDLPSADQVTVDFLVLSPNPAGLVLSLPSSVNFAVDFVYCPSIPALVLSDERLLPSCVMVMSEEAILGPPSEGVLFASFIAHVPVKLAFPWAKVVAVENKNVTSSSAPNSFAKVFIFFIFNGL
jgi:hypothetical protein